MGDSLKNVAVGGPVEMQGFFPKFDDIKRHGNKLPSAFAVRVGTCRVLITDNLPFIFVPPHLMLIKNTMSMYNQEHHDKERKRIIDEIMNKKSTYFIERKSDQSWVTKRGYHLSKIKTTKDPNKALVLNTFIEALNWMNARGIGKYNGWEITEHEFV